MFSGKICICKNSLNLRMMFEGGQCFRWKRRAENEWIGIVSNTLWKIKQYETYIEYIAYSGNSDLTKPTFVGNKEKSGNQTIELDTDGKIESFLKSYLRINSPLEKYYQDWSFKDPNFKNVASKCFGIRILDQDPVENLFSFICSSNNNIVRISGMVEKLCELYGPEICVLDGVKYYGFPEISNLVKDSVYEELREAGFGYRAKYIQQAARQLQSSGGVKWLYSLRTRSYEEAKSELRKLSGIGAKVADCICLMSLGHMCALPVDTHVFQIATEIYLPHLSSVKTITDRVYNEIGNFFRELYGSLAGWAHTILFCNELKTFKSKSDLVKKNTRKRRAVEDNFEENNLQCISGTLHCSRKDLYLRVTLNSGQTYRFKEIGPDVWRGVYSNYIWTLAQCENKIDYTVHFRKESNVLVSNENETFDREEMFLNMIKNYFRMDFNLLDYYEKWSESDEHFKKISAKFFGLRMVRQDIVENLFAFLCSSNNTISRMTTMMESLCSQYGEKIGVLDNIMYYTFPCVAKLSPDIVEGELKTASFGFRAKYIQQSAKTIISKGGDSWFNYLQTLSYEEAKKELMTLPGIADKIADCICLTALNHLEAIPVDTHVFQIAKKYYLPHLRQQKTVTRNVYQEIGKCFRQIFGEYSGWAHTVLFCSELKHHSKLKVHL